MFFRKKKVAGENVPTDMLQQIRERLSNTGSNQNEQSNNKTNKDSETEKLLQNQQEIVANKINKEEQVDKYIKSDVKTVVEETFKNNNQNTDDFEDNFISGNDVNNNNQSNNSLDLDFLNDALQQDYIETKKQEKQNLHNENDSISTDFIINKQLEQTESSYNNTISQHNDNLEDYVSNSIDNNAMANDNELQNKQNEKNIDESDLLEDNNADDFLQSELDSTQDQSYNAQDDTANNDDIINDNEAIEDSNIESYTKDKQDDTNEDNDLTNNFNANDILTTLTSEDQNEEIDEENKDDELLDDLDYHAEHPVMKNASEYSNLSIPHDNNPQKYDNKTQENTQEHNIVKESETFPNIPDTFSSDIDDNKNLEQDDELEETHPAYSRQYGVKQHVSEQTKGNVKSSINELIENVKNQMLNDRKKASQKSVACEKTLETFLADLVRPKIIDFLDSNLEQIVKEVVQEEIKKIVDSAK